MNQTGRWISVGGADSLRITEDPSPLTRRRRVRLCDLAEGEVE